MFGCDSGPLLRRCAFARLLSWGVGQTRTHARASFPYSTPRHQDDTARVHNVLSTTTTRTRSWDPKVEEANIKTLPAVAVDGDGALRVVDAEAGAAASCRLLSLSVLFLAVVE